ncbi:MAG: hypothetical protein PVJ50_07780 [Desulfobacterales bacterium]|jgi:hypothetical protein
MVVIICGVKLTPHIFWTKQFFVCVYLKIPSIRRTQSRALNTLILADIACWQFVYYNYELHPLLSG